MVEYRWDFNGDGVVAMTSTDMTVMHTYAATGAYPARITVVDNDGLTDTDIAIVTVPPPIPPTVSLSASPSDGIAPLDVVFTATATETDGQVVEYLWDFENDGVVDQTTTAITATHTYAATETYVAQVVAVDNDGLTDTDIAIVTVLTPIPPTVTLSVDPTEGAVPLDVTFTAAATDTDGQIAQYRWDFDGNSVVDQTTMANTTTHLYTTVGTFQPLVTAVDNDGLIATDTATVIVQPPLTGVTLSATPGGGGAPLEVQFTAAAVNPGNVVEYRWDFDGDETSDLTTLADATIYTYAAVGSYQATVEAVYQDETVVSDTVTIRVFAPGSSQHPLFEAPIGFLTGLNSSTSATGDFDGDGIPDIAVVEEVTNKLTVYIGNGNGTFVETVSYSTGETPKDVLVANFGGVAALDIAVAVDSSASTDTVMLFLGQGDGTFQTPVPYPVGFGPMVLVASDFDGVNGVDLGVLNEVSADISILLGNGDGTFQAERRVTDVGDPSVWLLAAGDVKKDGNPDLLIAHDYGLELLPGTGNPEGLFQTSETILSLPGIMLDLGLEDWDKDENPDVIITFAKKYTPTVDGKISILWGAGDGTFPTSDTFTNSGHRQPEVLAFGDFDTDGNPDMAFRDFEESSLVVVFGTGVRVGGPYGGPFRPTYGRCFLDPSANALFTSDFDGDGSLDVAANIPGQIGVYPGVVPIYLNHGDGSFMSADSVPVFNPRQLVLGNPGPFGIPDLVVDSYDSGGFLKVLRWDGSYSEVQSFAVPETISQMASGVLTSSGKLDVVVLPYFIDSVLVFTARPDGLFNDPVPVDVGDEAFDPVIADFNNDNNNDLLIGTGGHFSGGGLKLLLGNGDGTFQQPPLIVLPAGFGLHHPAAGDVNNDGNMDVVVTTESQVGREDTGFVLLGNGNGTFQTPLPISGLPDEVYFDTLADLDGNGDLDLVTEGLFSPGDMLILMGDGLGGFGSPALSPMGSIQWMVATDVNGDNVPDVVVISWAVNGVLVYIGVGDGTFEDPVVYMAGQGIIHVMVADLNNDGLPDISVSGFSLDAVFIMFGIPPL